MGAQMNVDENGDNHAKCDCGLIQGHLGPCR